MADEEPAPRSFKPWDSLAGETSTAYQRFVSYLELGPDRSLTKLCAELGRPKGYRSMLRDWSARNAWVDRARAYDDDELQQGLDVRKIDRERGRQVAVDRIRRNMTILSDLAEGRMQPGDQEVRVDRHGQPMTITTTDTDGNTKTLAVTRPLVTPHVRMRAAVHQLGLAGVTTPKRIEITGVEGDAAKLQVRMAVDALPPEQMLALAKVFGVTDAGD